MSKRYISFPLPPEMKEVNFKMLFEIYPTSDFLRLRFNLDVNNCVFVKKKSLDHLFFECAFVLSFWTNMQCWLQSRSVTFDSEGDQIWGLYCK